MAFENVQIVSQRNGTNPTTGWRQDLAIGNVVSMALTSNVGVSTYRWELIGRPEGSSAGGAGPEPILLGTSATASFTVDNDVGIKRDGTYVARCILNGGAPSEAIITVGLARIIAGLSFNGLPLRRLGGFETMEDTADPLVRQGWSKMLNRWLGIISGAGIVDVHDVKADSTDPSPAYLDTKIVGTGNITVEQVIIGGDHKIQISETGGTGVHNDLTGRDNDVALGEDGCHPADAVGPGRFHTPFGLATIIAGLLILPAAKTASNEVLVSGNGPLEGIATAGWNPGDRIGLTFTDAPHVITGATVGTGYAPLELARKNGTYQDIRFDSVEGEPARTNGRIGLQLRTDVDAPSNPCWQLIRGPYS